MHWYDWMTLFILVMVTIIQTIRGSRAGGMGLPLFEAAGVVAAAVAATAFSHSLAVSIHVSEGAALLVLFLVLVTLALILGRWLFALTGLSFESFDGLLSFLFGLVMAWTIAHMVLRFVMVSQGSHGELASNIVNSPVAREVFSFRAWNSLMRLLFRAHIGPEINPDVG